MGEMRNVKILVGKSQGKLLREPGRILEDIIKDLRKI
jgi:hypothetical protein